MKKKGARGPELFGQDEFSGAGLLQPVVLSLVFDSGERAAGQKIGA
jgi:hypothetical protein